MANTFATASLYMNMELKAMKQNPNFALKELAGVPYLLPFGQMIADHKKGLQTNATGVYLWNLLETPHSLEEVLTLSAAHYEISDEELPAFREEITQFIKELLRYEILTEGTANTPAFSTAPATPNSSGCCTRAAFGAASRTVCSEYLLSIGGLRLKLVCPTAALPPELSDFIISGIPANLSVHQTITLHPELPPQPSAVRVLLRNAELNIAEDDDTYFLYFPTAEKPLEIHVKKDGSCAHCYSPSVCHRQFHYDFFHALRLVYLYLAQKHGMAALHSASILYQNQLWLFSGHSGMGKSTHTSLWHESFHTPVINGDLNLLATENGKPVVHGTPWCGTSGIYDTNTYPLGGIILLNRSLNNYTADLSADLKQLLVSQRMISPSWKKELWEKNMEIAEQITGDILVCKLYCTKEKEAAEIMKQKIDSFLTLS